MIWELCSLSNKFLNFVCCYFSLYKVFIYFSHSSHLYTRTDTYSIYRDLCFVDLVFPLTSRELALKTTSHHKRDNWVLAITQVAESCEYTAPTPHASFAPQRKELAHWYVWIYTCDLPEYSNWFPCSPTFFFRRKSLRGAESSRFVSQFCLLVLCYFVAFLNFLFLFLSN